MLRFRFFFFTLAWNVPHLHICIVISEPSWIEFRLVLCFLLSHRISFTFNWNSWLILMTAKSYWNSRMHVLHVQSRQPRELSIAIRQSVSFSSRALNLPLLMMINESSRRSFFFLCLHLLRSTSIPVSVVSCFKKINNGWKWNISLKSCEVFSFHSKELLNGVNFCLFLLNRMHEWCRVFRLFSHMLVAGWLINIEWKEMLEMNKNHFVSHLSQFFFFCLHYKKNKFSIFVYERINNEESRICFSAREYESHSAVFSCRTSVEVVENLKQCL